MLKTIAINKTSEAINFGVAIMNSKAEVKGKLGHVVHEQIHVPPALNDNDDHGDDKLTIIMKWLKVLPWKGSRSWCQQKIPGRTVAMLSADVFLSCLDK